jgi:hypothetical protein
VTSPDGRRWGVAPNPSPRDPEFVDLGHLERAEVARPPLVAGLVVVPMRTEVAVVDPQKREVAVYPYPDPGKSERDVYDGLTVPVRAAWDAISWPFVDHRRLEEGERREPEKWTYGTERLDSEPDAR